MEWDVIIGASKVYIAKGIGKSLTLKLARRTSHKILAVDRLACNLFQGLEANIVPFDVDFGRRDSLESIEQFLKGEKMRSLVHCSRYEKKGDDISYEDFEKAVRYNIAVPYFLTQKLATRVQGGKVLLLHCKPGGVCTLDSPLYSLSREMYLKIHNILQQKYSSIHINSVCLGDYSVKHDNSDIPHFDYEKM